MAGRGVKGKGPGAHDSLIRAGNRIARYLEDRCDYMKRLGPAGYHESYGMLRALNNWRRAVHAEVSATDAADGAPR